MVVAETVINVDTIESIDSNTFWEQFIRCNLNLENKIKLEIFYQKHKSKLVAVTFAVLIGVIVVIAIQNKQSSEINYCESYTSDTMASEVSVKCLQQLWAKNGCNTKGSIPDSYTGFWLKSPEGGKLVMCGSFKIKTNCGIGSFQNICNWMYQCRIDGF